MSVKHELLAVFVSLMLSVVSLQVVADRGVGGDETVTNRIVNSSNAWTILTAEPFSTQTDITHCVATGSADSLNPNMGNDHLYRFTLSVDNANPAVDGPCERTQEFDAFYKKIDAISTTCTFRNLGPGNHTIYWLARKVGMAPNMTVTDNSHTFVCLNRLKDNDGEGDGGPD